MIERGNPIPEGSLQLTTNEIPTTEVFCPICETNSVMMYEDFSVCSKCAHTRARKGKRWNPSEFWNLSSTEIDKLLRTPDIEINTWEQAHLEWKGRHGFNWNPELGELLSIKLN